MNTQTTPADETPNLQAAQEREAEELARLGKEPTRPWREIKLDWQGLLDAVAENKDQDLLIERGQHTQVRRDVFDEAALAAFDPGFVLEREQPDEQIRNFSLDGKALTRNFKHTVIERARRDPEFATALLDEAARLELGP